ncbi:MAG: class I SAM-dependent methyltransferase [Solirubrobacteraceae bacterium]
MTKVVWHDVECARYAADLPVWRELAEAQAGPILDVGAGTGRVALDLARHGHEVVALDREPAFLDALRARAGELSVQTVVGDASGFDLPGRGFGLIVAPMQTIQLLGAAGRAGFLRSAREHLAPGGLVACALADAMEAFDAEHVLLPLPDVGHVDGVSYFSQPVALRDLGERMAIERLRTMVAPGGRRSLSEDITQLDKVTPVEVEAEARAAGMRPVPLRVIPQTDVHVGTIVVMFGG